MCRLVIRECLRKSIKDIMIFLVIDILYILILMRDYLKFCDIIDICSLFIYCRVNFWEYNVICF